MNVNNTTEVNVTSGLYSELLHSKQPLAQYTNVLAPSAVAHRV